MINLSKQQIILMISGGILLFLIFLSVHSVPAGHQGVIVTFGKVANETLPEGLHLKNPFSDVYDIDLREQREEIKMSTYTRDIQMAEIQVVFVYSLNGDNVNTLFRTIGKDYKDKLVTPVLMTAIKDIVGRWEADKLVENREKAVSDMAAILNKNINKDFLRFSTFSLTNVSYSEAFEKSIEEKQIATQNAIKAKNDTVRIREEANQRLISAQSEAKSMQIKSEALKANKSLIEYEAVQKWDGKLPTYMGSGPVPFINIK